MKTFVYAILLIGLLAHCMEAVPIKKKKGEDNPPEVPKEGNSPDKNPPEVPKEGNSPEKNLPEVPTEGKSPEKNPPHNTKMTHSLSGVHFHAALHHTTGYLAQHQRVRMDYVHTNLGGRYNIHNGVFSVPAMGEYFFYGQFATEYARNLGGEVHIMINGQRKVSMIALNPVGGHVQASGSGIFHCHYGDSVYMQVYTRGNGFRLMGVNYSNFGGFRLS